MAKKMKKMPKKEKKAKRAQEARREAWIPMRTGLIVVTLMSVAMAALTAYTVIPAFGWGEGLLWSLGSGGAVWLVFVGFFLFNRFVRGKRD